VALRGSAPLLSVYGEKGGNYIAGSVRARAQVIIRTDSRSSDKDPGVFQEGDHCFSFASTTLV